MKRVYVSGRKQQHADKLVVCRAKISESQNYEIGQLELGVVMRAYLVLQQRYTMVRVRVRLGYTMAICLVLQHQVSPW